MTWTVGSGPWTPEVRLERRTPTLLDTYVRQEYGDAEATWYLATIATERKQRKGRGDRWAGRWIARLSRAIVALR